MPKSTRVFGALRSLPFMILVGLACAASGCGGPDAGVSGAGAGTATAGGDTAAASTSTPPFLWEVRSGDHVSYLFGTCHAGVRLEDVLVPPYRAALEHASSLVLEADVTAMDPQAALSASMLPPDRRLDRILDADTYRQIADRLSASVPEPALRRMRPWLVSTLVVVLAIQAARPEAGSSPMDAELASGARATNVDVSFLEEPSEQIGMINGLPEAYFVESLAELVREPDRARSQALGLLEAYAAGDEAETSRIVFDPAALARWPAVFDAMFYARNQRWSEALAPRLRQGGLFVAVGVGHLLGERGLVAALRGAGFTVVRAGDAGFSPLH